jgi:predicted permease
VGQIALSLLVLVGAGLLVRTLQNLRQVDIGLDRGGVMAVTLRADEGTIAPSEFPAIRLELAERLKRVQGVGEIAFSASGLFTGSARTAPVRVPGSPVNPSDDPDVRQNYVSADYFRTLGMTVSKGRAFVTEDVARDADVAVINESMARHYFGDANPVGRMIYFPRLDERRRYIPFNDSLTSAHGYEVVGVVRDGKYDDLREPARRMAFLPMADGGNAGVMYVRVSSESNDFAAALQRAVIAVNPNLSVRQIGTLDAHIDATLVEEQSLTRLLSVFGAIALFLTCVGLYGVTAYTVGRRTSEIGLRVAVGARPRDVISMVLRETLLLAAAGVAVGIIASVGSLRILTSVLYGLTPRDPGTIGAVAALILIVLLLAAAIPARRAARIDPAIALRAE